MTWLQFFIWLTGLYLIYYVSNILIDWSRAQSPEKEPESQVLTFSEQQAPEQVDLKPEPPRKTVAVSAPPVTGLGGVSITGLFDLARRESIHLTRTVAF